MSRYSQCKLKKDRVKYIVWIPTKYAIKNRFIRIKKDGVWDNGWEVIAVFGTRDKDSIHAHERDNLLFSY